MPSPDPSIFDDLDLFSLIDRTCRAFSHFFDRIVLEDFLQRYGVSRRGLRILQALHAEGDAIDRLTLARLVGLDEGALKRGIIDLIGRELVATAAPEGGRRSVTITLTEKGRSAFEHARQRTEAVLADPDMQMAIALTESERMEIMTSIIKLESRINILNRAMDGFLETNTDFQIAG